MAKAKKLPSGSWNVMVYTGKDGSGKRSFHSITAPTKKEADYLAAEYALNLKHRKGLQDITVKEAMSRYIDSKESVLSPSTIREYRRLAEKALLPLHSLKLSNLTQEIIQSAISAESRTHSPKTVRNMHGLLSAAISMFCPTFSLNTTLPQKEKKDLYIPVDSDIKALLEYSAGKSIEVPILLASTGCLRRGEISALDPDDITNEGVKIRHSMVKDQYGNWVIKAPKTAAGYRFSPLAPEVIEKVRKGVPTIKPNSITCAFERALKACNIPHFSFHKLRHYYASVLHALNVPDKYIMQNGGWECAAVLQNVYQHALSDRARQENEKVTSFFGDMYSK